MPVSPKKNDVAAGYDHRESDVPSHDARAGKRLSPIKRVR